MIERTLISKAITLKDGESLCDFQCALAEALSKHLGLSEYDYCFLEVVYESVVVVWRWIDITNESSYIQFAYSRSPEGGFTFGEPVRVKPRTTFVPVT